MITRTDLRRRLDEILGELGQVIEDGEVLGDEVLSDLAALEGPLEEILCDLDAAITDENGGAL